MKSVVSLQTLSLKEVRNLHCFPWIQPPLHSHKLVFQELFFFLHTLFFCIRYVNYLLEDTFNSSHSHVKDSTLHTLSSFTSSAPPKDSHKQHNYLEKSLCSARTNVLSIAKETHIFLYRVLKQSFWPSSPLWRFSLESQDSNDILCLNHSGLVNEPLHLNSSKLWQVMSVVL